MAKYEYRPKISKDDKQLPLFVYGTLMKGEYNFTFIERFCKDINDATLSGFSLFDINEGWYPFMCKVESDKPVKGHLMILKENEYLECVDFLDMLERDYARIKVMVDTDNGQVCAWTYVTEKELDKDYMIKSNSWQDYMKVLKGEL